jgi:CTP synthase (UTP-ammonia lyase)
MLRLGLVGDRNEDVLAHRAIAQSLAALEIEGTWLPTEGIVDDAVLRPYDGVWCVPASPYRSMEGALRAIRFARVGQVPFLGTCGGFQHALVEYARSVLGWADAEHAESAPGVGRPVIAALACALRGVSGTLTFVPGSRLAQTTGSLTGVGGYQCSYGLNPDFEQALTSGPLQVTARDAEGSVRAIELDGHPFFVATLFQPERDVLAGPVSPVVCAFVEAARRCASNRR